MTEIKLVNPSTLAPAVGYAHVATSGQLVWLSGQISTDQSGALLHPGDIVGQFGQAIANVVRALEAANCAPHDVLKLTYYVVDVDDYRANLKAIGAAYRAHFGYHYPATTLVEVKGLFEPGALIEVEAVAVAPETAGP